MKYIFLFIVFFLFDLDNDLFCQSSRDTLEVLDCLEEIKYNCRGDTLLLEGFSDKRLKEDTSLIRFLISTKKFANKTIKRIRKSAFYFGEQGYEKIRINDSIFHRIDLAILNIFQIRFYCKTYRNKIIYRGLSLDQAYRPACMDNQITLSVLHPRLYTAINILTSHVQKEFVGCGLLLIDEWDRMVEDYRRLKNINYHK